MTIGIAAYGPRAGAAVLAALQAVEAVSRGEIRGFATLAAITTEGSQLFTTQRGGSPALFPARSVAATAASAVALRHLEAPAAVLEARVAGIISSGPDRPEPLERFIAVDAAVGLVTGHRFPDAVSSAGKAINLEVLELMAGGVGAERAVEQVMAANESADSGVIAVDLTGAVSARDSRRVMTRPDRGSAVRHDPTTGATVAVLHNAIHPAAPLAALAAEIAIAVMADWWHAEHWLTVRVGTPVMLGDEERVEVNQDLIVQSVMTTDASLLKGTRNGAAIYLGARVICEGRQLGATVSEGNMVISGGKIRSISGQDEYRVGCRLTGTAGSGT